jgi:hypothetical protein
MGYTVDTALDPDMVPDAMYVHHDRVRGEVRHREPNLHVERENVNSITSPTGCQTLRTHPMRDEKDCRIIIKSNILSWSLAKLDLKTEMVREHYCRLLGLYSRPSKPRKSRKTLAHSRHRRRLI